MEEGDFVAGDFEEGRLFGRVTHAEMSKGILRKVFFVRLYPSGRTIATEAAGWEVLPRPLLESQAVIDKTYYLGLSLDHVSKIDGPAFHVVSAKLLRRGTKKEGVFEISVYLPEELMRFAGKTVCEVPVDGLFTRVFNTAEDAHAVLSEQYRKDRSTNY